MQAGELPVDALEQSRCGECRDRQDDRVELDARSGGELELVATATAATEADGCFAQRRANAALEPVGESTRERVHSGVERYERWICAGRRRGVRKAAQHAPVCKLELAQLRKHCAE